jgi:hypothetical protein
MVTTTSLRKSRGAKQRFIGKPTGQIQERVQAAKPERFGIVAVDCAKRRSKWMLCNFYGQVIVEPTTVEHTAGGLRAMTQEIAQACQAAGLRDTIVAVEMTGIYHKPVYRACRRAGFDTRIVHRSRRIITAGRCIRTKRPTTTTWKRSFTPPSKATAWPPCRSARRISRCKPCRVTGTTWSSSTPA